LKRSIPSYASSVTSTPFHMLMSAAITVRSSAQGRWDMNVPIFVTAERAQHVAFSVPVWTLGDGFLLRRGNPRALTSYEAVAARRDVRLGGITGQVQIEAARLAGVSDDQLVVFKDQPEAVTALLAGKIDAFTGTAARQPCPGECQPGTGGGCA
jgi:polar amino acid transport system substrate-binding protein